MKKSLFLCGIIAAMLTACSDQQTMESILNEPLEIVADGYISAAQAVKIANDFAAEFQDEPGSRSINRKASSTRNVLTIGSPKSRAAEDLIYVVNYDDNQGFALVSKKETPTPILAFIPEGSYSEETASKIDGFQDFVVCANEYVLQGLPPVRDSIIIGLPHDSIPTKVDSLTEETLLNPNYSGHFIHTNWEQEGVFGKYCPNGECGCGPLTFAMVCAHYEFPKKIKITYDNSNREIELDWAKIKSHLEEKPFKSTPLDPTNPDKSLWPDCKYNSCTKDSHDQIGLFLRQIGHDFGATYHPVDNDDEYNGTSMPYRAIYVNMTKYPGFQPTPFVDFKAWYLKYYTTRNIPVILEGQTDDNSGGHMWICDGYLSKDQDNDGEPEDFFHYNWGYKGYFNGFFLSGVFQPKEGWDEYIKVKYCVITKNK
ncbi:MAG: C10 family peptidase [Muribaculaceae bacterium]|nr:C10 family peptidase [Muribaculaceae bacterium]